LAASLFCRGVIFFVRATPQIFNPSSGNALAALFALIVASSHSPKTTFAWPPVGPFGAAITEA
jgi:hypothetical protein